MDVILDADIASTFGKTERFHLFKKLFYNSDIFVTEAVKNEIIKSQEYGHSFAKYVLENVKEIKPSQSESDSCKTIMTKKSVGLGEAESLAIAKKRKLLFLTNDKTALKEARNHGVTALDLSMIIRQLWKQKILTKKSAASLISEIESKDNIRFVDKEIIFEG